MQIDSTEFYGAFPVVAVEKSGNLQKTRGKWEFRRVSGNSANYLTSLLLRVMFAQSRGRLYW